MIFRWLGKRVPKAVLLDEGSRGRGVKLVAGGGSFSREPGS